jgi:FKBP-type peptidyl-prolyl cis-trans isomerase
MSRLRLALFCLPILAVGCGSNAYDELISPTPTVGFSATDLRVGSGVLATTGRLVSVNYSLWLYTSTAADNKGAFIEGGPFEYVLGSGGVIAGWEQGIPGMRVGGTRKLVVPPSLAYGSAGSGPIPGSATLIFEIALLNVQ